MAEAAQALRALENVGARTGGKDGKGSPTFCLVLLQLRSLTLLCCFLVRLCSCGRAASQGGRVGGSLSLCARQGAGGDEVHSQLRARAQASFAHGPARVKAHGQGLVEVAEPGLVGARRLG